MFSKLLSLFKREKKPASVIDRQALNRANRRPAPVQVSTINAQHRATKTDDCCDMLNPLNPVGLTSPISPFNQFNNSSDSVYHSHSRSDCGSSHSSSSYDSGSSSSSCDSSSSSGGD